MNDDYNFSIEVRLESSEDEFDIDLSLGEIEEYIESLGEYDSVERQKTDGGNVFHVKYDDFALAVGIPYIKLDVSGNESQIKEIVNVIDNLLDHILEKYDEDPNYRGNMGLNLFANQDDKLFTEVKPPISEYQEVAAMAVSIERSGQKFGLSINESNGEKSLLNINYSFKVIPTDEEDNKGLPKVVEIMFESVKEIADEVAD